MLRNAGQRVLARSRFNVSVVELTETTIVTKTPEWGNSQPAGARRRRMDPDVGRPGRCAGPAQVDGP